MVIGIFCHLLYWLIDWLFCVLRRIGNIPAIWRWPSSLNVYTSGRIRVPIASSGCLGKTETAYIWVSDTWFVEYQNQSSLKINWYRNKSQCIVKASMFRMDCEMSVLILAKTGKWQEKNQGKVLEERSSSITAGLIQIVDWTCIRYCEVVWNIQRWWIYYRNQCWK